MSKQSKQKKQMVIGAIVAVVILIGAVMFFSGSDSEQVDPAAAIAPAADAAQVPAAAVDAAAPQAGYAPAGAVAQLDGSAPAAALSPEAAKLLKPAKPYRTFITIQRYNMEQSGDAGSPIANVRIRIKFPNKTEVNLPEGNSYWPIGNGQVQEINRTFELPYAQIAKDGFKFEIQMERKGSTFLPCMFDIIQLSEFNRAYICRTEPSGQGNIAADKIDREGVQIRVYTDLNSEPKEIPSDAIALR